MSVVVLVPFRTDHGHRARLWEFLRDNYWAHLPYRVVVGDDPGSGAFNRSAAVNAAAAAAGEWEVAVVADSDSWVPARQLYEAVDNARLVSRLTSALTSVVELNRACTEDLLAGRTFLSGSFETERVRTRELETQSSVLAVPRCLWDDIGGFDERFCGWGGEDNAFWRAAHILGVGVDRIPGNAFHLWHPAASGKHAGIGYKRNLILWRRYEAVSTLAELRAVQNNN